MQIRVFANDAILPFSSVSGDARDPSPGMAMVENLAFMRSILKTAHSASLNDVPWKQTRDMLEPETSMELPSETLC